MGGGDIEMFKYDFVMLEMFDQVVRITSGGEMQKCYDFIKQTQNRAFANVVKERVGENVFENKTTSMPFSKKFTLARISNKILRTYLKMIRCLIPTSLRDEVFINTGIGERHKWMYDRFSLSRLLRQCGFIDITKKDFNTSHIPHFNTYLLDMNADNTPYKGDSSLYMEALKP